MTEPALLKKSITEDRISTAKQLLTDRLGRARLDGLTFLDVHCGVGLFSVAAHRLGATVLAFEDDPELLADAKSIRSSFASDDAWTIVSGAIEDKLFMGSLELYDIVHSSDILDKREHMYHAVEDCADRVKVGGVLYFTAANDQGLTSKFWGSVKKRSESVPSALKTPFVAAVVAPRVGLGFLTSVVQRRPKQYVESWTKYSDVRGTSRWSDLVQMTTRYPYHVSDPGTMIAHLAKRHLHLDRLVPSGRGFNYNEYIFTRHEADPTFTSRASA